MPARRAALRRRSRTGRSAGTSGPRGRDVWWGSESLRRPTEWREHDESGEISCWQSRRSDTVAAMQQCPWVRCSMAATTSVHRRRCYSRGCEVLMAWLLPSTRGAPFSIVLPGASAGSTGSSGAATHRARPCGSRGAYGGSVAAVLEMSRLLGGSRAAARGGAARLKTYHSFSEDNEGGHHGHDASGLPRHDGGAAHR